MKKLSFLIILFVLSTAALCQDSLDIKTSLTLQTRDWLYLNPIISSGSPFGTDDFENVYDSMKVRLRATAQPALTTSITVTGVTYGQIISLARIIKGQVYSQVVIPYTRLNTAFKASAPYVSQRIDAMDAEFTTRYNAFIQTQIQRLRRQL